MDGDTGYPVADVARTLSGGSFGDFENGIIYAPSNSRPTLVPGPIGLVSDALAERVGRQIDDAVEGELTRDGPVTFVRRTDYQVVGGETVPRCAVFRSHLFHAVVTGDISVNLELELLVELNRSVNAVQHRLRSYKVDVTVPPATTAASIAKGSLLGVIGALTGQSDIVTPGPIRDQIALRLDEHIQRAPTVEPPIDTVMLAVKFNDGVTSSSISNLAFTTSGRNKRRSGYAAVFSGQSGPARPRPTSAGTGRRSQPRRDRKRCHSGLEPCPNLGLK